jgi:hypothetical protein
MTIFGRCYFLSGVIFIFVAAQFLLATFAFIISDFLGYENFAVSHLIVFLYFLCISSIMI